MLQDAGMSESMLLVMYIDELVFQREIQCFEEKIQCFKANSLLNSKETEI